MFRNGDKREQAVGEGGRMPRLRNVRRLPRPFVGICVGFGITLLGVVLDQVIMLIFGILIILVESLIPWDISIGFHYLLPHSREKGSQDLARYRGAK